MFKYTYNLGLAVDGIPFPDPAKWSGSTSDLDTSAERDATGLLHRAWVAQKVPVDLSYSCIGFDMLTTMLKALNHDAVQFTFFDPNVGALRTGNYYVGDRKWECIQAIGESDEWLASLSFSIIEY